MIKQNDKRLLSKIQKIGCYYRCCAAIAEMKTGKELTAVQLNDGWCWAKKNNHINLTDDLLDRHAEFVINYFLGILDNPGKVVEIGIFESGKFIWYGEDGNGDFFIQKIVQNGPSKTHFRIVDKYGVCLWDPVEPAIKVKGVIYSRIFKYKESIYDI